MAGHASHHASDSVGCSANVEEQFGDREKTGDVDGEFKEVPRETARRVLQAAAVEAHGRAGVSVSHARVMGRAAMVDWEGFKTTAEYLEWRGCIADAAADYDVFTVTISGVDEAMK